MPTCNNCGRTVESDDDYNKYPYCQMGVIQSILLDKVMDMGEGYVAFSINMPPFGEFKSDLEDVEGLKLLEKMKLQEALNYYDKAIEKNPNNIRLWNNFGVGLNANKNRKYSLKSFEKSLEIDSEYEIGLYNMGVVHHECKQYDKAIEYYDKVLTINPKFSEVKFAKTLALEDLGEDAEAFSLYNEIPFLEVPSFYNGMGLLDLGDNRNAYIGYVVPNYRNREIIDELNNESLDLGRETRYEDALVSIEEAIKINPFYPESFLNKAACLLMLQRNEEALETLEKATELNPQIDRIWIAKALSLLKSSPKKAINCFNIAQEINPFIEKA